MKISRIVLTLALLMTASIRLTAQPASSLSLGEQLQRSQALLYELEGSYSNDDPRLTEPLYQIAQDLMAIGRRGEAHTALDRAMQIVRINEGLYTSAQLPYLKMKIENLADWRDWDRARNQLQHLFWLYRTKSRYIDATLINNLQDLSQIHLRGVMEDGNEYQSYHFRRAVSANWLALSAGEALWSKQDQRLIPIIYDLLKHYHMQSVAIRSGGRTGYELRQIAPGTDWVRDRVDVQRYFYFTGQGLLNQLNDIYANAEPADPEGLAMANLYMADWQVLFSRDIEALENYQMAYQGLEQAGVAPELLDQFFGKPTLLPESEFHPSLQQALAARSQVAARSPEQTSIETTNQLYFAEWSSSFPFIRKPDQYMRDPVLESNFALFSFNLAGVPDISQWVGGRDAALFSSIQEATLVEPQPRSENQVESLMKKLETLRFRPSLHAGLPQESDATLLYQLAGELPE